MIIAVAFCLVFAGSALYDQIRIMRKHNNKPNPRHNDLTEIY